VSCQLDHLCELPTDALRRKALTCLPATLNETYARVLTRVDASARPLVRRTLQWITYAPRPGLSVEELSEIVAIDENDEELDPEACPEIDDLLRYCGSLVRKAGSSNDGSTFGRLELAHFTVQEFLEAIDPNDMELEEFHLRSTNTLILARTAINYLCLPSFDYPPSHLENGIEGHPFYKHASLNLQGYIYQSGNEENLREHLQRLFRPPKSYNLTRLILHRLLDMGYEVGENEWVDEVCSYGFSSLHAAAMFNFETVCRWLIDVGCDVNQRSALGTPLEWVVVGPYLKTKRKEDFTWFEGLWEEDTGRIISTLLEAGATYNSDGVDLDSLFLAVSYGPPNIMAEMLRYGMPLQTSSFRYLEDKADDDDWVENFLLSEDAIIPLEVRVRLLELARTKDIELKISNLPIDTTTSTTRTMSDVTFVEAITYIAKYGPVPDLLHLTADERFSVNMQGPCRSATLLHIAAEHNSPACMELLLDKGFDADYPDEHGRTALHYAISYGVKEESLLRRLIRSNATEVVDCDKRSVWHVVAEKGRLDVLDILIAELGPDHPYYCMQSRLGRTPLLEAVHHRQSHIASRILRLLPADKTFATDLQVVHSAVATGLEDILLELVEMGASVHTGSGQDQSALYFITQETTPRILETLLGHGLDVDRLDSYGRSPLIDFLEVDKHSQRLEALGYSESNCKGLDLSVMELLATPFCSITQDKDGNFAWFYFCTKTIPHHLLRIAPRSEFDSLIGLSDILTERGALEAYEEATVDSGIALLIKTCLDTVSKASMEDQKAISAFVKAILRHVFETISVNVLLITHSQAVRLLIWSMTQSDSNTVEQLLRLGVDVHATCEYYGEDSAVEIAIERKIEEKPFDMILANADSARIPKLDANGSIRHFVLCRPAKLTNEGYAIPPPPVGEAQREILTSVSKLEGLLRKGVDPNARSVHGWTAAMVAAVGGQLECVKLLVAYSADLLLMDQNGYTVIHYAVQSGHLILLEYLRRVIEQDEEWRRSARLTMTPCQPDRQPLGPLSHWGYLRCSPTHFAAYTHGSDTLQFLHDENVVGNINAEGQDSVTPLHFAVCMNSPQATRWLLENGADIKAKCGKRNISALHIAMRWGRLENAIALIEAGAEFCADSAGITPEMQVDPAICANLLELLPNVGLPIPPTVMEGIRRRLKLKSSGSLYRAIADGDLEACRTIIADVSYLDKPLEECNACKPLMFAVAKGRPTIARLLLDRGAVTSGSPCPQIRQLGIESDSVLDVAVQQPGLNGILEQLLDSCLLNEAHWIQSIDPCRPLHLAAANNPAAIRIIAKHILKHIDLFRYVYTFKIVFKNGRAQFWSPPAHSHADDPLTRY
jgi:ankyrin repeat protein